MDSVFQLNERIQLGRILKEKLFSGDSGLRERFPDWANFSVHVHGFPMQVFAANPTEAFTAVRNIYPREWLMETSENEPASTAEEMRVYLLSPEALLAHFDVESIPVDEWEDVSDSNCFVEEEDKIEIAAQRDFLGIFHHNRREILIIGREGAEDAYFNACRWFLPRFLLEYDALVLHSSAVALRNDRDVCIFLGPSGAGKSTVASKHDGRTVLGDDMSLLRISDAGITVETAALGQNTGFPGCLGRRFQLGRIFWLSQSERIAIEDMPRTKGRLKLLASVRGLFWENIDLRSMPKVLELVERVLQQFPMERLESTQAGNIWNEIELPR